MTKFENWDSYFLEMVQMPKETIVVQARRSQMQGRRLFNSGSKNNPYLKQEHLVEIPIDIHPPSLVPRIVAVREQISREFCIDLDLIRIANDEILTSYEEETKSGRSIHGGPLFERNAMLYLTNNISMEDFVSSPIRKGTFDLLQLLSLHESVHRVLRREYPPSKNNKASASRDASWAWLRDYYSNKVGEYFDGCQRYGRADDFIEELLKAAPVIQRSGSERNLVDTLAIASEILEMRSQVLREWKDIVEFTVQDHVHLKKSLLKLQWERETDHSGEIVSSSGRGGVDGDDEMGSFE